MANSSDGTKKRKPPTFQHLPVDRAKKLKRSWVEVQKIKSQWKAQKRKEGLVTARTQLTQLVADADTDMDRETTRPSHNESRADALEKDSEDGVSISENADESSEEEESGSGSEGAEDESDDASSPPPARKRKEASPHSQGEGATQLTGVKIVDGVIQLAEDKIVDEAGAMTGEPRTEVVAEDNLICVCG
ncbi:predicted protein [Postia placenta Mad-698-R]|uniref:Uncharacterized protein n=1 Tax=Postia placenta MAD-698-R-SB12 TaxID=670580 RepID=A0A1X6NA86_9APHY|nr:hypothetical protein POSPLADRAFT_1044675 [Postia placenta MAD-698-R-SB12]EED79534.1 predicted protein [Postia placenta Mad-698-R]OSX65273.1 hypothetical protein POSPLADRAFT_1044675 [Postia placenta MAD-698-R-SB12]